MNAREQRAPRSSVRRGPALGALLAVFAAVAGCGQRGPLTLPDSARPIERLDPSARPEPPREDAQNDAGAGAAPAEPREEDSESDGGAERE